MKLCRGDVAVVVAMTLVLPAASEIPSEAEVHLF